MRKIVIVSIFLILLSCFGFNIKAEDFSKDVVSAVGAEYQVNSRAKKEDLGYGIVHLTDIASSRSNSQIVNKDTMDPQAVNVLEIPSSTAVKVVNWTYSTSSKWSKQTIRNLAKDYEKNNPGWVVLAGVNGDFFDINGLKSLPYQTTGAAVVDGDVLRPNRGENQVGFTNNGTSNSLVGGKTFYVTPEHYLAIYDENSELVEEIKVDKFNELPTGDEISVYFSYNLDKTQKQLVTAPQNNSYLIENSIRCYGMSSSSLFAKGVVSAKNVEKELYVGQFAIVTENKRLQSILEQNPLVRVQQNIVGDFEECTDVTGAGVKLVENGEGHRELDGMSDYRHPRTVVGKKEDGTIVLATVDGRQEQANMYGMTYQELSAMMLYYGCTEAYNLDGGGSTTMIIRDGTGEFVVQNSPSDKTERSDSNAILVVARQIDLKVSEATDTSVELYYNKTSDIKIKDLQVTIKSDNFEKTQKIDNNVNEFIIDGLLPEKSYEVMYNYTIEYNNESFNIKDGPKTFQTGKPKPTVKTELISLNDEFYLLSYKIDDPNNVIYNAYILYNNTQKFISTSTTSLAVEKALVSNKEVKLVIEYNLSAKPGSNMSDEYIFANITAEYIDKQIVCSYDFIVDEQTLKSAYILHNNERYELNSQSGTLTITKTYLRNDIVLVIEYEDTKVEKGLVIEVEETKEVENNKCSSRLCKKKNTILPLLASFTLFGLVIKKKSE